MSPERDRPQAETRHVTRMPDGRVLKGPRPAQRRNAQFWSGVAQETENLLQPAATTADDSEPELVPHFEGPTAEPQDTATAHLAQDSPVEVEQDKPAATRKTRGRSSSSGNSRTGPATRKKKTDAAIKPRSTGPKPSQRGYKWPAS